MRETDEVARLRLFLVEPSERGSRLAQAMPDACLGFARAAGRLFARNGFRMAASRAAHGFGQATVEQEWERALTAGGGAPDNLAIAPDRR